MSFLVDMSFKNEQIKGYFNGSDVYVPSSELIYVHTHPLINPNFLSEIEVLIHEATEKMVALNMRGAVVKKFTDLTIKLGRELPDLTDKNAASTLGTLREVYKLCKYVIDK